MVANLVIGWKSIRICEGMLASMTMVSSFEGEHCDVKWQTTMGRWWLKGGMLA
jgi:hypothetical protein